VDVVLSLHRAGFAHIVLANAHLDPAHTASLHEGVRVVKDQHGVTVRLTPTPSHRNLSSHFAASLAPPMHVSAVTHSTGRPHEWRSSEAMRSAAARAICITVPSKDSRTPP
jgi:hypothetical protein